MEEVGMGLQNRIKKFLNDKLYIKTIVNHISFEIIMLSVVLVNTVVVILGFVDTNPHRTALYDSIDYWLVVIYIIEFLMKVIGLGIFGYFRDNWNVMDFSLIVISLSTDFAFTMLRVLRNARAAKATRITKVARVKKAYRLIRSIKSFRVGQSITSLVSALVEEVHFLHNETFEKRPEVHLHDRLVLQPDSTDSHSPRDDLPHLCSHRNDHFQYRLQHLRTQQQVREQYLLFIPAISDFTSYDNALVVMLCVVTENGWSNIIYDYAYKFESFATSSVFFNSFYLFVKFIILSLLTGLIWEIFTIISSNYNSTYMKKKNKEKGNNNDEDSNHDSHSNHSEEREVRRFYP